MKDDKIKKQIDRIIILIDSREKLPNHITKAFDKYGVNWERVKLDSGDYSAILPEDKENNIPEIDLREVLCIERKMSCDEIIGNLTRNKERFNAEFSRTNAKMPILIEDTFKNACTGNYISKVTSKQFLGALFSFCDRYDTFFYFIEDKDFSALWIYNVFKYRMRNILKEL